MGKSLGTDPPHPPSGAELMEQKRGKKKRDTRMTIVSLAVQIVLLVLLFGMIAALRKSETPQGPPGIPPPPPEGPDLGPVMRLSASQPATDSTRAWVVVAGSVGMAVVELDETQGTLELVSSFDPSSSSPSSTNSKTTDADTKGSVSVVASSAIPGSLYVAHGRDVHSLSLDMSRGLLSKLSASPASSAAESGLSHLAVDPSGKWLLGVSTTDRQVEVFPLEAETGKVSATGTPATRQFSEQPSSVYIGSNGKSVFMPCPSPGGIRQFLLDASSGDLRAPFPSSLALAKTVTPIRMAIAPSGHKAFVLTEGGARSPQVLTLMIRPDGTLVYSAESPAAVLPEKVARGLKEGDAKGLDLTVDQSGQFLVASATVSGTQGYVAVMQLGDRERVQGVSMVKAGVKPTSLALSPSGTSLVVVDSAPRTDADSNVFLFQLDDSKKGAAKVKQLAGLRVDDIDATAAAALPVVADRR